MCKGRYTNSSNECKRCTCCVFQDGAFALLTVMQYCSVLAIRQHALRCLERFIRSFDDAGQLAFIRLMFHELDRPGSRRVDNSSSSNYLGWLIDYFRNRLACSWSADLVRETPSILSMSCFLPNAEQSDLLERRRPVLGCSQSRALRRNESASAATAGWLVQGS